MYAREIANDFVASAWTRITSADRGVKWYAEKNRAMISWAGFQDGSPKLLTYNRTVFCAFRLHFLFLARILNLLKRTFKENRPNVTITMAAVTFAMLRDYLLYTQPFYWTIYMLHILIVYTFYYYFLFVYNFNFSFFLLSPKYVNTLIKLLLTFLP